MRAFVYTKKGYIEEKELKDVHLSTTGETAEEDRYACVLKPVFVSPCSSFPSRISSDFLLLEEW